jgi:hypothetical protein
MSIEFIKATKDDAQFICSLFTNDEYEQIFAENHTSVEEWEKHFDFFKDRYNYIVVDANNNKKIDGKFKNKHVNHDPNAESARTKFGLTDEGKERNG